MGVRRVAAHRSGTLDTLRPMSDFNAAIIDEFRANGGNVGGQFEGAPMVLLHTVGARSGEERVNPLVYQADGDRIAIFGSKAGAPTHPAWYHNLLADPDVTVELGPDTVPMRARVAEPDERERIWSRQKEIMPGFADYEANTTRVIPVVILERV
jgi:deazaflavin-dependent oxidoreductase (nitroreductase family)